MHTYLYKSESLCVCIKVFTLPSLGHHLFKIHQNNCEWNSKILAEDREREEIQITFIWGQKPKFQVQTHILLFLGQ